LDILSQLLAGGGTPTAIAMALAVKHCYMSPIADSFDFKRSKAQLKHTLLDVPSKESDLNSECVKLDAFVHLLLRYNGAVDEAVFLSVLGARPKPFFVKDVILLLDRAKEQGYRPSNQLLALAQVAVNSKQLVPLFIKYGAVPEIELLRSI
jgi:hypothetical protein